MALRRQGCKLARRLTAGARLQREPFLTGRPQGLGSGAMGSDGGLSLRAFLSHFDFMTRIGVLREYASGTKTEPQTVSQELRHEYCCDWFHT
jgi:hypothetical protein